jgi:hypothetical protein
MITRMKNMSLIGSFALLFIVALTSCKKDVSNTGTTNSSTIAVAASESAAAANPSAGTDSVYIVQPCNRNQTRNAISETDLSAAITTYLSTNYPGYSFVKAFAVVNTSGSTDAYVVVIFYNDKPVGLLFDSTGNFVKVLEQREKRDIDGRGWHEGGRFCDRNGLQKDTIALTALPSSILAYMATNYPQDTLVKAFQSKHDSSYAVISKNNGLFVTIFDASGNFKNRVTLPAPPGNCVSISQSALPTNVQSYLSTTYPNYVFEKAFAAYANSALQGYVVIINANNTKYAVKFDASGNFVSVKTIW